MGEPKKPVQIRALPRGGKSEARKVTVDGPSLKNLRVANSIRNGIVVLGSVVLGFWVLFNDEPKKGGVSNIPAVEKAEQAKLEAYLKEAELKQKMAMRSRELENQQSATPIPSDAEIIKKDDRTLGVYLDTENREKKVYEDLYGNQDGKSKLVLPEDRINARLAQRKWITEEEKQEKKQWVQNFIKQAYDAGWAVEINEDLIVTKAKPVRDKPRMSLDQVIDKLSREGY